MRPPHMPFLAFLRQVPQLLGDRPDALLSIARTYGDLVRVPVPGKTFYLVSSPAYARRVLQTNAQNYRKSFDFRIVRTFLGQGLITVHDELWEFGRKAAKPALKRDVVDEMVEVMTGVIAGRVDRWAEETDQPFLVLSNMTDLTLKILTLALFGVDVELDADEISRTVNVALRHLDKRLEALVDFDAWFTTPSGRRFNEALAYLHQVIEGWIDARREGDVSGHDLMGTLIRGASELPPDIEPRRWLRDQVITFLMAGHETSAVAMAWCFYVLTQRDDIQQRLAEESASVLGGRVPTQADLDDLQYHQMVIRETLRVYSPVWALGRESVEDDQFDDYVIPGGSTVMVCPYVIHRHPDHWEDPEAFRPERFADDLRKGQREFTWLPFSSGPRVCMGARLGTIELTLILAMMVQRFEISLDGPFTPGREALISLRPKPDIPLRLKLRAQGTTTSS